MQTVFLQLPYPPVLNRLYRAGQGRFWMIKEGYEYKQLVHSEVVKQKCETFGEKQIRVKVLLYRHDNRKVDIDGPLKILLDSMQLANVYNNDNQIQELFVKKMPEKVKEKYVEVYIESM